MFEIVPGTGGHARLSGRLDAANADDARAVLDRLDGEVVLDCAALEYISSAGIAVLMATFKRLQRTGSLTLVGMTPRVRNVFRYAGLDRVLTIR
jgi:anti-sigma B factor antagonist